MVISNAYEIDTLYHTCKDPLNIIGNINNNSANISKHDHPLWWLTFSIDAQMNLRSGIISVLTGKWYT